MIHPLLQWANQRPGILLPVFFLSFFFGSTAQGTFPNAGVMARGEVCSVGTEGAFAICNPAILGSLRSQVYLAGHSRPFAIREIGVTSIAGILPVHAGTFRTMMSGYGISGYRDLSVELAYGMQLAEHLSAGISFRYYNTAVVGDLNYLWTVGWSAGLLYAPSSTTHAGIYLLNPVTVGNHPGYGPLFPAMIAAGISHLFYDRTTLLAECSYHSTQPVQLKFALEYVLSEWAMVACGFHTSPATYAFGAGFNLDAFGLHLATAWSALPGVHPSVLFTWQPGR